MAESYRSLFIWQSSVQLAVEVLGLVRVVPPAQRHLAEQMERAAVSVASNIAEGWGRGYPRQLRQFLCTSRGSLFELHTQIEIAIRAGLLARDDCNGLLLRMSAIAKELEGRIDAAAVDVVLA
jgi:four helix bundle protein